MIDPSGPASRILAAVQKRFAELGVDLPPRQYVAAGAQHMIAIDDEHLMVSLVQMSPGAANSGAQHAQGFPTRGARTMDPPRADYMVRLMRCVAAIDDTGQPPDAATLNADGMRLLKDPGLVLDALIGWAESEPAGGVCTIGAVQLIGPEGRLAGHELIVTISPVE